MYMDVFEDYVCICILHLFKWDIFIISIAYLSSVNFQLIFLKKQMYVFQGTKNSVISCFKF